MRAAGLQMLYLVMASRRVATRPKAEGARPESHPAQGHRRWGHWAGWGSERCIQALAAQPWSCRRSL